MIVLKLFIMIILITITVIDFLFMLLYTLEHFNLIESDNSFDRPLPYGQMISVLVLTAICFLVYRILF